MDVNQMRTAKTCKVQYYLLSLIFGKQKLKNQNQNTLRTKNKYKTNHKLC